MSQDKDHAGEDGSTVRGPAGKVKLSDQFKVGQELRVWSERVFGVPVHFRIAKVGRKLLWGTMTFGVSQWEARIPPSRIVES